MNKVEFSMKLIESFPDIRKFLLKYIHIRELHQYPEYIKLMECFDWWEVTRGSIYD